MLPQQGAANEIGAVREIEDGILGSLLDGGVNACGIIGDSVAGCTQRLNVQNAGVGGDFDGRSIVCWPSIATAVNGSAWPLEFSERQEEAEYPRSCACNDVERYRGRSQLLRETRCTFIQMRRGTAA